MADDGVPVVAEGCIAQDMVRVGVGVDDVADGQGGAAADRGQQLLALDRLPPLSITATLRSPTTKPRLAMPPAFSAVKSSWRP